MSRFVRSAAAAMLAALSIAPATELAAQSGAPVRRVISIGNHPRVDGIRINFRDRELDLVRGANITIWSPSNGSIGGEVKGLALGLPITAAGDITGIGAGIFGVAAEDDFNGLGLAGVGIGAGGSVRGIMLGGIGVGAGSSVRGILLGGVGVGAGSDLRGIAVGGIGAGIGGSLRGIAIGGLGVGAGGSARGIVVGGVGAGIGGSMRGIAVGGLGVGAGGDVSGITVGGLGVGSGGTLRGISVGGLGVGAPRIRGIAVASVVGTERSYGLVIAPALFRTTLGGQMTGASISSVNYIPGSQRGLTIGLVNYTERLRGVQLGAINIVADRPWPFKVMPVLNVGVDR